MNDRRPLTTLDPAFGADVKRSKERIADLELGLTGPDAEFCRAIARRRIRALEEDLADYGLLSHEYAELERLRQLVRTRPTTLDLLSGAFAFALCVAVLVAIRLWGPQ